MELSRLTNKGLVAAIVFDNIELASFEDAETIGWEVCAALGVNPDASWTGQNEEVA